VTQAILARIQADVGPDQIVSARLLPSAHAQQHAPPEEVAAAR
jgi:hypothetical protein